MHNLLFALTMGSALGCALMAGVFFAFSTFVMPALARLPAGQGIAAMQSINRAVITAWFLTVFIGTAAACLLLALSALWNWHSAGAAFLLAGSLLYLLGTFLVTIVFNVPMNESLDRVEAAGTDAPELWADYLAGWTKWNHLRTAAALLAAAALITALCL